MIAQIVGRESKQYVSELLDEIIRRMHIEGPVNAEDFEKLAYIKSFHPEIFRERESELLYIMGLFYKVDAPRNIFEEVYSIFADAIVAETGKRFTPVQADAYRNIHNKRLFSFSAPTSAGKSFLFRELITNTAGDIIIVVPSRALIAEYLNLVKPLVDKTVLVLQFIENVNIANTRRRIYIITPERGGDLFQYKGSFNVTLFLFDEAQLSEEEIRGIGFDAFVRRVSTEFPDASKVFAHPYVQNPEAQLNKHDFPAEISAASTYEQNTVGKIFITLENDGLYYFSPYEGKKAAHIPLERDIIREIMENNGSILIYASKAKLYSKDYLYQFREYLRLCPRLQDRNALKHIERLREYIGASRTDPHKSSVIVRLMERGIVIHHGSIPLKMRLIIEEFVRENHARLCFATSTLKQGINMPFDAVFIDNYTRMDVLTLKNLIGRSGRTTERQNNFEYGYTFIEQKHLSSFCKRINEIYELNEISALDADTNEIDEDNIDLVEAIKNNTFDNETRLTQSQLQRIQSAEVDSDIELILSNLLIENRVLTGAEYYENLDGDKRQEIKEAFKRIYMSHLKRKTLKQAEQSVFSTAIPILLWQIQGKAFKEVLALRFSYMSQRTEQRKIVAEQRAGRISEEEAQNRIRSLTIRFSQAPATIPNSKLSRYSDFPNNTSVLELDYDTLVFDTYDYIDKVIGLSLSDPLCAAFKMYHERTGDARAAAMCNYIRYGTNDDTEIWLLRYGFSFEDIEWIKPYVQSVDEQKIVFLPSINELDAEQKEVVERYL